MEDNTEYAKSKINPRLEAMLAFSFFANNALSDPYSIENGKQKNGYRQKQMPKKTTGKKRKMRKLNKKKRKQGK